MILECPNCRESVSFLRSVRTTAWGSFPCRTCGSILGISFGRRLVAVGIWFGALLFVMEYLRLYAFGRWVTYALMMASMGFVLYLFEKIVLIERRAFTCKQCGYDLHQLPESRCPECGREFDPAERERILARIEAPPPRAGSRLIAPLLVILLALTVAGGLVFWQRSSRAKGVPAPVPSAQPAPAASPVNE